MILKEKNQQALELAVQIIEELTSDGRINKTVAQHIITLDMIYFELTGKHVQ